MTEPIVVDPAGQAPADRGVPSGWRGRLMPVNTMSGDKRMMTLAGDIVPTRPMPVAFSAQEKLDDGHDGSVVVGLIVRAWLQDGFVWGEGPFDLADPVAHSWARKLGEGYAGWVSIDLSDAKVEEVPLDAEGNEIPDEVFEAYERAFTEWEQAPPGEWGEPPAPPEIADTYLRVSEWKVMGATLVSSPAFEDARVYPVWGEFESTPAQPALVAAAAAAEETEQTGAMVALVPAEVDALAVDGGDPPEQLHLTLAYLGEAVDWSEDQRAALTTALTDVLGGTVTGKAFGHGLFNPSDPDKDPCAVYLVDSPEARELRAAVADVLANTAGLPTLPEQHEFIPHITAGYGLDIGKLEYTGPVTFPRLRIAFADANTDLLLDTEAMAASANVQYRHADFHQPEPDHYVDTWQVTPDGKVSMHLAAWGECHIGYADQCVAPPPGVDDYARFHRLAVDTDQGPVKVGKITMGAGGHASGDPRMSVAAVRAHYDNTTSLVAVVRCTDGIHGPWLSGHLVPWATPQQAQQLAHHEVSGDWRGPSGRLELVAALAVNVPGFMRSVAASGMEALVAAGRPRRSGPRRNAFTRPHPVTKDELRAEVRAALAEIAGERAYDEQVAPHDARVRSAILERTDRRVRRGKWGTQ